MGDLHGPRYLIPWEFGDYSTRLDVVPQVQAVAVARFSHLQETWVLWHNPSILKPQHFDSWAVKGWTREEVPPPQEAVPQLILLIFILIVFMVIILIAIILILAILKYL